MKTRPLSATIARGKNIVTHAFMRVIVEQWLTMSPQSIPPEDMFEKEIKLCNLTANGVDVILKRDCS